MHDPKTKLAAIRDALANPMTPYWVIGERHGVPAPTIAQWMARLGHRRPRGSANPAQAMQRRARGQETTDRVARMVREHPELSYAEIGERMGLDWTTIMFHAHRAGIKRGKVGNHNPAHPLHWQVLLGAKRPALVKYAAKHPEESYRVIAERFGVGAKTAQRWARADGVQRQSGRKKAA